MTSAVNRRCDHRAAPLRHRTASVSGLSSAGYFGGTEHRALADPVATVEHRPDAPRELVGARLGRGGGARARGRAAWTARCRGETRAGAAAAPCGRGSRRARLTAGRTQLRHSTHAASGRIWSLVSSPWTTRVYWLRQLTPSNRNARRYSSSSVPNDSASISATSLRAVRARRSARRSRCRRLRPQPQEHLALKARSAGAGRSRVIVTTGFSLETLAIPELS